MSQSDGHWEDCRARPGYYTDGLPKISDEIVGQALHAYLPDYDDYEPYPGDSEFVAMRAALESVLPGLEREWRKGRHEDLWLRHWQNRAERAETAVEGLVNTMRDTESEAVDRADKAQARLAERDQQIERLTARCDLALKDCREAEQENIAQADEIERLRSSENKEIVRLKTELAIHVEGRENARDTILAYQKATGTATPFDSRLKKVGEDA